VPRMPSDCAARSRTAPAQQVSLPSRRPRN
jgi:hypothetical protein